MTPTSAAFLTSPSLPALSRRLSPVSPVSPCSRVSRIRSLPASTHRPLPILSALSNPPPPPPPPSATKPAAHTNTNDALPPVPQRLFSNLSETSDGSLQRSHYSEIAATLLVAGTMIGAGVLALPTVAQPSGFVPSSAALLAVWAYMATTGLLISEVTIATACATGRVTALSMMSLAKETLGPVGTAFTTFTYALLHYAILTAYTAQTGTLLSTHVVPHWLPVSPHTLSAMCGAVFTCGMGVAMLKLPAKMLANVNNTLVALAGVSFSSVLLTRLDDVHASSLVSDMHWGLVGHGALVPVLFVSCVYHNIVTGVTVRLEGDGRKIRRALLLGSGVPVVMFTLYDAVMLAVTGSSGSAGVAADGGGWAVTLFSFLAIATSVVGFVEGLSSFVADGRRGRGRKEEQVEEEKEKAKEKEEQGEWLNYAMTVVPPTVFAAVVPDAFFNALDVAGTYGIAGLFGTVPALMAWKTRRRADMRGFGRMVGGGNTVLALIAAVPMVLIVSRMWQLVRGL